MIYKWAMILGIILGVCSCSVAKEKYSYQIQGIEAYKGQDVSDLLDINGAPNAVKNLSNGNLMWIYYTNYRPVGGGELITYTEPNNQSTGTNCIVKVIISNNTVMQVMSNCM